jgi:glycosyltransferase involved in cell wall biosynthesis
MSPRVTLVVTTTATERGDALATRLRMLLEAGWDARLLAKGERWAADPALRQSPRVEVLASERDWFLPPRRLLARPVGLARYLSATGRAGALDQRLLELRPDLIHFHSAGAAWKAMRLKRLIGCRVVLGLREDMLDLENPLDHVWDGADRILLPDTAALERASAVGCPPEKVEFLPRVPWNPSAREPGLTVGNGRLRLLSVGPLNWEQGYEHSVQAVRLLLDAGVDVEYSIVGGGQHLMPISYARHQLRLADRVRLLAPDGTLDLEHELRSADVFVDPAVSDTTSAMPVTSAQSAGVPYVATQRPGLRPGAGIVVERRSARALANAIAKLASDPGLRERMGRDGRNHDPSDGEADGRLLEIYRTVLA